MIIFDTTILLDLMKSSNNPNYQKAVKFLKSVIDSGEGYCTTFLNVCEIRRGAYSSDEKEKELKLIESLLYIIPVIEYYNDLFYDTYSLIYSGLVKNQSRIGDFDELIASIAVSQNARLVTRNKEHFERIKEIDEFRDFEVISY